MDRMFMERFAIALLALATGAGCAPQRLQPSPPAEYANPVLDSDFPDPAVVKAPDGFYYAYATQTERDGRWINLQVARSRDLRDWEHLGDALYKAGRRIEARFSWRAALVTAENKMKARIEHKIETGLTPATSAP